MTSLYGLNQSHLFLSYVIAMLHWLRHIVKFIMASHAIWVVDTVNFVN
ncbi:hypothetical protein LINPERPRIM_LOCUS21847 [Linum perenne]